MAKDTSKKEESKKASPKKKEVKKVDYQKLLDDAPSNVVRRQMKQEFKKKGIKI